MEKWDSDPGHGFWVGVPPHPMGIFLFMSEKFTGHHNFIFIFSKFSVMCTHYFASKNTHTHLWLCVCVHVCVRTSKSTMVRRTGWKQIQKTENRSTPRRLHLILNDHTLHHYFTSSEVLGKILLGLLWGQERLKKASIILRLSFASCSAPTIAFRFERHLLMTVTWSLNTSLPFYKVWVKRMNNSGSSFINKYIDESRGRFPCFSGWSAGS